MARSTSRGNRFDNRSLRSNSTNRRAKNFNTRSARSSSFNALFEDGSLGDKNTRIRGDFSQIKPKNSRRGNQVGGSFGRDTQSDTGGFARGRSFQARSSRRNDARSKTTFRDFDFAENREERRNPRTRDTNNRQENLRRKPRREFGRSEFSLAQASGDVFDKYLNKRENPLESFKDLAGEKFKDVFASSRNNFENPFEVKDEQKTDIFGQENLNNNSFGGQAKQGNQEFVNPFQEFLQRQNQQNSPNAGFNPNQQDNNQPLQDRESQEQEASDYKFFNPFERVKPSPLGEEQSPKDLFSFSRGNAKTQNNQGQGLQTPLGIQEQEGQVNNQGSGFEVKQQSPVVNEDVVSSTDDEEYDEVFEYSEIVDSKTDPNIEDESLEQESKEHEFFDHVNIAEEGKEDTMQENTENKNIEDVDGVDDDSNKKAENIAESEPLEDEDFSEFEQEPKSSKITTVGTILFSVLSVLFVSYMLFFNQMEDNDKAPELNEARPVKIFDVKEKMVAKDVISARVFPAQVIAFKDIDVSFKLAGKIKNINVKEGDYVKKGQIIATLDDVDYKYNLEKIEPNLKKLEADYKRAQELFREQVASKAYLEEVEDSYFTVKKSYEYAKTQLSETVLKSPYAGTILKKYAEEQEYVNPGTLVFSLSSSDKIEIESFFTEKVIQSVVKSKSQGYDVKASFSASDNKYYTVDLSEFSSVIDPITQSYRVKYIMKRPKDISIFAGMIAYLHVEPKKQKTLSKSKVAKTEIYVPISSVNNFNNRDFVWVVGTNNTVSRRYVELGGTSADNVLIKSGLKDGERIVQAGVHFIKDGQKVNILAD